MNMKSGDDNLHDKDDNKTFSICNEDINVKMSHKEEERKENAIDNFQDDCIESYISHKYDAYGQNLDIVFRRTHLEPVSDLNFDDRNNDESTDPSTIPTSTTSPTVIGAFPVPGINDDEENLGPEVEGEIDVTVNTNDDNSSDEGENSSATVVVEGTIVLPESFVVAEGEVRFLKTKVMAK